MECDETVGLMIKTIKVTYFANLKEHIKHSEEEIVETSAETPEELYNLLREKYSFEQPSDMIKVAINGEFASMRTSLKKGDSLAFLPPMSGG